MYNIFPDSLVYNIYTQDFYADLLNNLNRFNQMDAADLSRERSCFMELRKKLPGYV